MSTEQIRAFCIDFNWDLTKRYASPGLYAHADADEHLAWYQALGVNTIQSFCVSHNGYAWYESDLAPVMPGMKAPFFTRLAEKGKAEGMRIMGYFSPGANEYWRYAYPELSHDGTCPTNWHMPYSNRYNDYLAGVIEEAMRRNPIDGFMIDFMWQVEPTNWMQVEREIYEEVMEEKFPRASLPDAEATQEYGIRSVRRAWTRLREAAKAVDPQTLIWLSCNDTSHPQVLNTGVGVEADWLMNEHPHIEALEAARKTKANGGTIMQCVCGWGDVVGRPGVGHDAEALLTALSAGDVGIYGFAQPDPVTTLPRTDQGADARNIATMRARFN